MRTNFTTREHRIAQAMYEDKIRRNQDRTCPRKYCRPEFKAIESHPGF